METSPRQSYAYRLAILLSLVCVTLATQNCDRQSKGDIPSTAQKRLSSMVESLPPDTGAVGVVSDLKGFQQTSDSLQDNLDDIIPVTGMVERNIQERFGVNLSTESLKQAGVAPGGGLSVADVRGRPTLLTYYKDRQKFESHLTEQVQQSFGIQGAPSSTSVGDHKLKALGDKEGQRVAWGYQGRLAVVAFPQAPSAPASATVTSAVQSVLSTQPEDSFARQDAFERFRSSASEHQSFVFFNTNGLADRILDNAEEQSNPSTQRRSAQFLKQNFDGFGGTLESASSGIGLDLWLGLAPDVSKSLHRLQGEVVETDWTPLATDQTVVGLRMGFPPGGALEAALNQSTDRERRAVERRLQRLGDTIGLDLQADVLDHLSGEMGMFLYGFGPKVGLRSLQGNPNELLRQTGLIVAATFDDAGALRDTLGKVADNNGFLNYRSLESDDGSTVDSIKVLEFTNNEKAEGMNGLMGAALAEMPIKFYAYQKQLVISTTAIGESSMRGYLTGSRDEASPLSKSDSLELGAQFASASKLSGLYLNMPRAKDILKDKLPPLPAINRVFNQLEEILVTMTPRERAATLHLEIARTPSE